MQGTDSTPPNFLAAPAIQSVHEGSLAEKFGILDRAAKKDLHWWFFVLLMIGMSAFAFLYYDMRTERTSMRAEITELRNSQLAYVTAKNDIMMTALINNTRALEANTQTLNRLETRKYPNE